MDGRKHPRNEFLVTALRLYLRPLQIISTGERVACSIQQFQQHFVIQFALYMPSHVLHFLGVLLTFTRISSL